MTVEVIEIESTGIPVIEISTMGIQGPAGGTAIIQDFEPPIGSPGRIWFNDLTKVLYISDGTQWLADITDGGNF